MDEDMEFDATLFLAAIVASEGGEYVIPFSVFEDVAENSGDKVMTVDPTDDGTTVTVRLISASEVPDGLFNE